MTSRPSHISDADFAKMKRLKSEDGLTHGQLANLFGLSEKRVKDLLRGVPSAFQHERDARKADLDQQLENARRETQEWLRGLNG
ncbi:MAG: hypothetical protein ACK4Y9_12305 [Hyphomonas sp.]